MSLLRAGYKLFTKSVKIYYTYVYSHLNYCIEAWGNAYDVHVNQLTMLQKCALRFVAGTHKTAHTIPIAHELSLLFINDMYMLKCASMWYILYCIIWLKLICLLILNQ